jgi:hypothetical protein
VVPKASIAVTRNLDYDFVNGSTEGEEPYKTSKQVVVSLYLERFGCFVFLPTKFQVLADADLHLQVYLRSTTHLIPPPRISSDRRSMQVSKSLEAARPSSVKTPILSGTVNASADR